MVINDRFITGMAYISNFCKNVTEKKYTDVFFNAIFLKINMAI